ncbi:MAG: helix-turn-helix transcriptional regulator [Blautia sp.]|nr:helix-turn-helix transcriptional regulator [Blautia sp.]
MDSRILGANIRKYRLEKGLTQDEAAELCGLSENYFRQIELGNKTPQVKTLVTIAEVLEAPADNLLAGNITIKDHQKSKDLLSIIDHLPANRRKLVLTQIETLLKSLESL